MDSSKYPSKKDITPPIGARLFLTSLYSKLTSLILLLRLDNKIPNFINKNFFIFNPQCILNKKYSHHNLTYKYHYNIHSLQHNKHYT